MNNGINSLNSEQIDFHQFECKDSDLFARPSITFTSQGSVNLQIRYTSDDKSDKSIQNQCLFTTQSTQTTKINTDKSLQASVQSKNGATDTNGLPKSIVRELQHLYILNIDKNITTKSESTQCGQIHLKRNRVKIVKNTVELNSVTKEELEEAIIDYKNTSEDPPTIEPPELQNKNEIMEVIQNVNAESKIESLSTGFNHYDSQFKTQPSYDPLPILADKSDTIIDKFNKRIKFKPLGIYGQTTEIGRFAIHEVPAKAIQRPIRKRSVGSFGSRMPSRPMIHNYSDAVSPFQFQPSSYVNSAKGSYTNGYLNAYKRTNRKRSPLKKAVKKQSTSMKEDPHIIEWTNSILYYNIKNGIADFVVGNEEVFHEFEIQYMIDSFKSAADANNFREKISKTVMKLSKEQCISLKEDTPINMFYTAKILFEARFELVEFLTKLTKRELLILKDIMYMINDEYIKDKKLLIMKVTDLKNLDDEIIGDMSAIQSKYKFLQASFMLSGIEIKLMISVEWKDIVRIMKEVHNITI